MTRQARKRSKSGIYHIMERGINKQDIFHDPGDYQKFLTIMEKVKEENTGILLGYCLMPNHVHLLIQEKEEDISTIMKRVGTSYAGWYNWKYDRIGPLFQGRFKSECVESQKYLMTVIRYIHQNPVKAHVTKSPKEYKWSSCRVYYSKKKEANPLIQTDTVLDLFSDKRDIAIGLFIRFNETVNNDQCLENEINIRIKDQELRNKIEAMLENKPIFSIVAMPKDERNKVLKRIKTIEGVRLRQIVNITGISLNIVFRA